MTTRVGIIGCGFIAALHSRALLGLVRAGHVDAAVVATCDTDPERASAYARPHGARATTDAGQLLDAVDAVFVCTPTASHRDLVAAAAGRGVAVFCEKPLAPTGADAAAMATLVAEAGVAHQVGLVLRTQPVFVALRDLLASGAMGRPMAAVLRDDQFLPVESFYASTWRSDVSQAGGGTLIEHSIHDVDLFRFLLGEIDRVSGRTACFAGHPGIEDVAVATFELDGGATASLVSVWHQVQTRPSTRRLEVLCEHGLAWTDDDRTGPLHVLTDAGEEVRDCPHEPWVEELPISDPAWRRWAGDYAPADRAFLEALAAGRAPEPGFDVAVRAHEVVDATYRSAAAGGEPVPTRC